MASAQKLPDKLRGPGDAATQILTHCLIEEQAKCPSVAEWIKKIAHTEEYYSAIKNKENPAIFDDIDGLEVIMQVNKSEKDKCYVTSLIYGI